MEFIRKAVRVGNSSGVILPRKLLGSEVKVIVVNQPINIKKEALKLLDDYLEDLLGVYITNKKPVEILAVSNITKEILESERIKINIIPFSIIKRDIKNPKLKQKIVSAETIFNKKLLTDLGKEIKSYS